jgi:excisionase family DNA binding protein
MQRNIHMTKEDETILTIEQASKIMNVSKAHIYRLIRSGILPRIAYGRTYRLKMIDIQKYMESQYGFGV